jgi:glycosyltransferase involved in cell wall biosynthesis
MDPVIRRRGITPMVLLIGNYPLERQHSMQRFAIMMLHNLSAAGIPAEIINPRPALGRFFTSSGFISKWLAYIDKFILFPRQLRAKLGQQPAVVHICDHSNAMYDTHIKNTPVVVTCHDLIAVRSALGEELHCPVSFTGKFLQRWILRGLRQADAIACISDATLTDAQRLVSRNGVSPVLELVALGFSYPYRKLSESETLKRLEKIPGLSRPFVLHVGSNLPRKNRAGVLRIFAAAKDKWTGSVVFAGDPLNIELTSLAEQLGISERIVQIKDASEQTLEALYNGAVALLYPSYSEGFGWPVIEAQACGCPVICSNVSPLLETAGQAGLFHDLDDERAFTAEMLRLNDSSERAVWSEKSLRNAERFSTSKMTSAYIDIYRRIGAKL